jgi:hypothetical protein
MEALPIFLIILGGPYRDLLLLLRNIVETPSLKELHPTASAVASGWGGGICTF